MESQELKLTIKSSKAYTVKVEDTLKAIIEDFAKAKHLPLDEAIIKLIKSGIEAETLDKYEDVAADYRN